MAPQWGKTWKRRSQRIGWSLRFCIQAMNLTIWLRHTCRLRICKNDNAVYTCIRVEHNHMFMWASTFGLFCGTSSLHRSPFWLLALWRVIRFKAFDPICRRDQYSLILSNNYCLRLGQSLDYSWLNPSWCQTWPLLRYNSKTFSYWKQDQDACF